MTPTSNNNDPNRKIQSGNDTGKFNLELVSIETHRGTKPGEGYARVKRVSRFTKAGPGYFVAKPEKEIPKSRIERGYKGQIGRAHV